MTALLAYRVGEEGFAAFVRELERLRVLTREDRLRWLALHGTVMRATLPPLDDGRLVDAEELEEKQSA